MDSQEYEYLSIVVGIPKEQYDQLDEAQREALPHECMQGAWNRAHLLLSAWGVTRVRR